MTTIAERIRDLERVFRTGDRVRARLTIHALDGNGDAWEVPEGSEGRVMAVRRDVPLVEVRWATGGTPRFVTSTEHLDQVDA